MKEMTSLDLVTAIAKALKDWDGTVDQAVQKLSAAVQMVRAYGEQFPQPEAKDARELNDAEVEKSIRWLEQWGPRNCEPVIAAYRNLQARLASAYAQGEEIERLRAEARTQHDRTIQDLAAVSESARAALAEGTKEPTMADGRTVNQFIKDAYNEPAEGTTREGEPAEIPPCPKCGKPAHGSMQMVYGCGDGDCDESITGWTKPEWIEHCRAFEAPGGKA